jgi:hypothetical protein
VDIHYVAATGTSPHRLELLHTEGKPDIFESVPSFDPTAAELAEYPGAFVSEEIDPIYRIAIQDDKLTLSRLKHKPETLRPATRDVFIGDIGTIRFTRDASKKISGFILDAGRVQNFKFTKRTD